MLLIPKLDLKDGKCARSGSEPARETRVHSDRPAEVASQWAKAGARRLHVVDLDGVHSGKPVNAAVIRDIVDACRGIPVQVSGGIRSDETAGRYFEAGASFVILGTKAMTTPHLVNDLCLEYPGHIIVGLDVRGGKVAAEGWSKLANHDVREVAEHFQREGAAAIVYNDLEHAGRSNGLYLETMLALARAITIPVIAAGELTSLAEVKKLCEAGGGALGGAILGRGLYAGTLDFVKAQKLADSLAGHA